MNKFKLKSNIVKNGITSKKCIEVYNSKDELLCLIWADGHLSPQAFEFELKEIEYFVDIAKRFYTTFENLELIAAKDEEIKNLTAIIRHQETEIENIINQSVNH